MKPSLSTLNKELRLVEQQFSSLHLTICSRYCDSRTCFKRHSSFLYIKSVESFSPPSSDETTYSATVGKSSMTVSDHISDIALPAENRQIHVKGLFSLYRQILRNVMLIVHARRQSINITFRIICLFQVLIYGVIVPIIMQSKMLIR